MMSQNNEQIKKLIAALVSSLNSEEITQILSTWKTEKRLNAFKKILEEDLISKGKKDEII